MIHDILLEYSEVLFVACNDRSDLLHGLNEMGIDARAYDYDVKFKGKPYYIVKDFVFDGIEEHELVVNWNCEKTYPLGLIYEGDMVLIGDNKKHNGDCNPISSCEQLIHQNKINTVYTMFEKDGHYVVHGSNIS